MASTLPSTREPGLWLRRENTRDFSGRPALFLDRDGVIVKEINYLHRIEDCEFIDGAKQTIRRANELNVATIIVTNQSGVGRGYYDWAQFTALQDYILAQFREDGAEIDMVLGCAYHPDGQSPYNKSAHDWRKPNSGMLTAAAAALGVNLGPSWLIGDSRSDIDAAHQAGLAGAFHVLTGHGVRDRATLTANVPSLTTDDLSNFEIRKIDSINDAHPELAMLFGST
ncbi:MAG: HAD family hydrolase [Alphaproteobacteria bacterium]|nr:HAD family hydrolase [Alphaproteobacteria bacterium]